MYRNHVAQRMKTPLRFWQGSLCARFLPQVLG
jgi:hypothetical protein